MCERNLTCANAVEMEIRNKKTNPNHQTSFSQNKFAVAIGYSRIFTAPLYIGYLKCFHVFVPILLEQPLKLLHRTGQRISNYSQHL